MSGQNLLAKNLEFLLKKKQLSPTQLSAASGVDKPIISRILSGKTTNPQVDTLKPIAEFFDITIDQLIGSKEVDTDRQHGVVVSISRLLVPLIEWKHIAYWMDIKESYSPSKTVDARVTSSPDSFALVISNALYEPHFTRNSIIIVDPSTAPKDRDYILTRNKSSDSITIAQLVIDNDKTFVKTISPEFEMKRITKPICFGVITESHLNLVV